MNRFGLVALSIPALLISVAASPSSGSAQQPAPVTVTNFPSTQQVAGTVAVGGPMPSTRLESNGALVSPALPTDLNSLTDGGVLDASGFVSATFSLAVAVQGSLGSPGKVGALLVPDVAEILSTMRNSGVVQFPIAIEAPVAPSPTGIHQAVPVTTRLGFPRYRVFFYNTTPRSSQLTLYSYLGTS
jgi:hypothetical protein